MNPYYDHFQESLKTNQKDYIYNNGQNVYKDYSDSELSNIAYPLLTKKVEKTQIAEVRTNIDKHVQSKTTSSYKLNGLKATSKREKKQNIVGGSLGSALILKPKHPNNIFAKHNGTIGKVVKSKGPKYKKESEHKLKKRFRALKYI